MEAAVITAKHNFTRTDLLPPKLPTTTIKKKIYWEGNVMANIDRIRKGCFPVLAQCALVVSISVETRKVLHLCASITQTLSGAVSWESCTGIKFLQLYKSVYIIWTFVILNMISLN